MQNFVKNIENAIEIVKDGYVFYTDFLNEAEQALAVSVLKKQKAEYSFDGGYESARRKILAISKSATICFPYTILKVESLRNDDLKHGDYLGSVLSLGIERDVIGDIVLEENGAYIVVVDRMSNYICQNLLKIKNNNVNVFVSEDIIMPFEHFFNDIQILISSNRLDCYIASISNISREKSVEMIKSKKIFINNTVCEDVNKRLFQNDILTLRGFGKYVIFDNPDDCQKTRKNRLKILLKKYGG